MTTSQSGTLGRSISLNASASWSDGADLRGVRQGTVTEVGVTGGDRASEGAVLYTVNEQPVIIAQGAIPAYRDLAMGAKGQDVAQLQAFLNRTEGAGLAEDGDFAERTLKAVSHWQKDLGLEQTGVVPAGQLLFVPTVPVTITWAQDFTAGAPAAPGEIIGTLGGTEPTFSIGLPPAQAAMVEPGMAVSIAAGNSAWPAQVGALSTAEDGTMVASLVPGEGADSICAPQCDQVPVGGAQNLRATITIVPEQSGTIVPVAALQVAADGSSAVVLEDGTSVPVTVTTSVGGRAIVEGLETGARIRVAGDVGASTTSGPSPASSSDGSQSR
ncbi:MAG: peptidoglycan-binding protein [Actinomyces sp.]|nr:peptidoglycan-binding domain-containing protein [Actinomyces sp.]MCI1829970.1 peptidoglycan-binding protein [Actinomyces sp.]